MPLPMSLGSGVRVGKGQELFDKAVDHLKAKFLVRHFTAAEAQRDFHFHVFTEKSDGVLFFDPEIMRHRCWG